MRRSYRQSKYLGIIERVRAAMPDAAITTDIIVGFPGETEEDFQATLDVVAGGALLRRLHLPVLQAPRHPGRRPRRPGPARRSCKDRYERLVELVNDIAWEENKALVGRTVELMVAEGEGRKDAATHRLSGRAPRQPARALRRRLLGGRRRLGAPRRHGRPSTITYAAPHHLVADGAGPRVRRTRAGDAWEARTSAPPPRASSLGMPTVGVPAPLPAAPSLRLTLLADPVGSREGLNICASTSDATWCTRIHRTVIPTAVHSPRTCG